MKFCKACGRSRPLSDFECFWVKECGPYYHTLCRECRSRVKECPEKRRIRTLRWQRENRAKKNAHLKVYRAVKTGKLKRLPCERCGDENVQAHHERYDRPLEIMWLCGKHHAQRHRELRN